MKVWIVTHPDGPPCVYEDVEIAKREIAEYGGDAVMSGPFAVRGLRRNEAPPLPEIPF